MSTSLITRTCATLITAGALAGAGFAPAASAMPAPSGPSQTPVGQDLRSPDTRDAASGYSPAGVSEPVAVAQDLRSPDTRDVASGYDRQPVPEPIGTGSGDGFDWVSGAIGAAVIGGLILLLLGFVGTRRIGRRHALRT